METATIDKRVAVDERPEWARYPEKGLLLIKALNTKDQLPCKARPCEDATGRIFTGQGPTGHYETLSNEDKERLSFIITPDSEITLSNDKVIDLDKNPIDQVNWVWLRKHPYLALSKEKAARSRDARFYIEDAVAEAANRVSSAKVRDRIRYQIQETLSKEDLIKTASLLGNLGADGMSVTALQDYLLLLADSSPDLVAKAINPGNPEETNAKLLLMELTKYKLIQRGDGGQFRFGGDKGMILGHTPELVVSWLMDGKNSETVQMMRNNLTEKTHGAK